jgi:hypothetical protein
MKKQIYTLAGLILMAFSTSAQTDIISSYFSDYEDREDVTTVMLSGKTFELLGQVDVEGTELQEYKEMAYQIIGLRLILDDNDPSAIQTAKAAQKRLPSNFEELISVKEKDNEFKLLIDEQDGVVRELIGIFGSENTFAIMSLVGNMKMRDVGQLTQQLMKAGSSVHEGLGDITSDIKVFPNPVEKNGALSVELSDDLKASQVRIYNSAGTQVKAFTAQSGVNRIEISGLEKGVYVIRVDSDQKEVSGKFIIQ